MAEINTRKYSSVLSKAVLILRVVSGLMLSFHFFLQVREVAHPWFFFPLLIALYCAAFLLYKSGLRSLFTVLLLVFSPILLYGLFSGISGFARILINLPEADYTGAFFSMNLFVTALPAVLLPLVFYTGLRHPGFRVYEGLLYILMFFLLSWGQARYQLTMYAQPSHFAAAVLMFFLIQLFLFSLYALAGIRGKDPKKLEPRRLFPLLLLLLPLLLFVFYQALSLYAEGSVAAGGGLLRQNMFRFDFSQYVTLESEISLNDDLVLLVRKEGAEDRVLLRRYILSGYTGEQGFHLDEEVNREPTEVEQRIVDIPDPEYINREPVEQEIYVVNFDPTSLVAMNYPTRVTPYRTWDEASFLRIYRVLSMVSNARIYDLAGIREPDLTEDELEYYTRFDGNNEIHDLALDLTENVTTYLGAVLRIRNYLKDNYLYSLNPGTAPDGDQLGHFLFESQKGYCSYFAFAMTLMLRSLDIPARVAVGFFMDPDSEVLHFYPVRADMAHAWVEVYFNEYGWIEFDPTSTTLAPGENIRFGGPLEMDEFSSLIEEILDNQDELEIEDSEEADEPGPGFFEQVVQSAREAAEYWYIIIPVMLALFYACLRGMHRLLLSIEKRPRKRVIKYYYHSLRLLAALGNQRNLYESREEYALRVEEEQIRLLSLSNLFVRAQYAKHFTEHEAALLKSVYTQFLRSYKKKYSWYIRLLGNVNPVPYMRRKL